uniref:UDENN domain-containing protein n=1 Tax=Salvator merianae TaxID=96440 RepID=A0A8D0C8J9_SALMN
MDCRIKENPESTFDLVLQVKCQASENEDPVVLWKFPEDFGDKEVLQIVPKFCFPFDTARVTQVGQHFTFVLTDIESKQRFGFCRLTSGGRVCLCILSYLPWFEIYYKLLNTLADYLSKEKEDDLNDLLETWYRHPVPAPNAPVSINLHSCFIAPDVTGLPTVPESRNLTEYFVAVDVNNMLQLYASMLHERRIIITSSKLSTLTACVHGSAALLYPMYWQHIYIPVLPPHLLDYCCAPMPYLIGVHFSLMERVKNKSLEDVVMLNVDTNTLETPFNDLSHLPSEVVSALKNKLKKQSTATGDGVARAFLRAQAALFGSYRDALRYKPGEPVTFCEESFVKHRSSTTRQFLETAVNLQLFKQFIEGRLAKLNAGKGFSDVFEEEISSGGFSGGNSRSYHQWVYTVKKGGALINTAVNKASPAMKIAYRYAKNHAKQGIREVKSKLKHKETEDDYGPCSSGFVQYTPIYSLHNTQRPYTEKRRLAQTRFGNLQTNTFNDSALDEDMDDEMDRGSKLSSEDSEETSCYLYDSDDSGEMTKTSVTHGEMDLLGEILDTLSTHSSDQGKLSGAKSLDFFRSMEDIDYKMTNKSNTPSESNLALLCSSRISDPADLNIGPNDSNHSEKHLPPSPRKHVSSSGHRKSPYGLKTEGYTHMPGADSLGFLKTLRESPNPSQETIQLCSPGVFQGKKTKWNETLSSISADEISPDLSQTPSALVPWEKEVRTENEIIEEGGLLHEVVSLCKMTSAFSHGFNISGDRFSGSDGNKT